jgi:hypothetical protein
MTNENVVQGIVTDNNYDVPYYPLLRRIFQVPINVEYYSSVESIKYVNRGSDQAMFGFQIDGTPVDEVERYQLDKLDASSTMRQIYEFCIF